MIRFKNIIKNTIENSTYCYIILLLLFILGTVVGSLLINIMTYESSLKLVTLFSPYVDSELNGLVFLKKSLIQNYVFIGSSFLLGVLNLGFLTTLLIFLKGSLLGSTIGFIIKNYRVKGFFVSLFGIYPQYIIYLPCIVTVGVLSILFDTRTNLISNRKSNWVNINLSDYIVIFIFITFMMTIGVLCKGFISPFFFKF